VERIYLVVPALGLFALFVGAFCVYGALHVAGRPPHVSGVKHNQLFGRFCAGFIVWLVGPIERALVGRVSPNVITLVSLAMCVATGVAAGTRHLGMAVWLYAFAGILDILDGRIARLAGAQTKSGALLDSVSDRWGELAVFAGYIWYLRDSAWLLAVFAAIGASLMVSYTRARAESLGVELSGGMMQRAERIVLVTGGTLVAAWYAADVDSTTAAVPILGVTMLVCAVTSAATALRRWMTAFRLLAAREGAVNERARAGATRRQPRDPQQPATVPGARDGAACAR
jgi:CDP-diacylglycerol--glycerol-3-phosphate 3-phosphatidyltransferase